MLMKNAIKTIAFVQLNIRLEGDTITYYITGIKKPLLHESRIMISHNIGCSGFVVFRVCHIVPL